MHTLVPYRQTRSQSRADARSTPETSGRAQSASSHVRTRLWRMPPHAPPAPLTGDETLLVPLVLTKLLTTQSSVHLMDPEKRAQYEHGIPVFLIKSSLSGEALESFMEIIEVAEHAPTQLTTCPSCFSTSFWLATTRCSPRLPMLASSRGTGGCPRPT